MKSPFKFLDSYTKDDRDIFFGRDREIEELYQKVFESKLLLVYGVSGTGKSSLIHCGLANKFRETDWLPLIVRRGVNIIKSLDNAIKIASITSQKGTSKNPADFRKSVRSLYLDHYKPIFFIFDQFEEIFIFGDKEERQEFVNIVKSLLESDLQCRLIFIMREEYMAGVTEFEKYIPTFFSNRTRIEKMSHLNALEAIKGPCKASNINIEEGFAEALLQKLSPGNADIELTYLQVFLDKAFRLAAQNNLKNKNYDQLSLTVALLNKIGNVTDLLGGFLDDQLALLTSPETGLIVLKALVSVQGTKRQMNLEEIGDYAITFGKAVDKTTLKELIQTFISLRILCEKDENGRVELRHDAIAMKIFEKFTLVEKELLEVRKFVENSYFTYEKRNILLNKQDLDYLASYENRLTLPNNLSDFVTLSRQKLFSRKKALSRLTSISTLIFILILATIGSYSLRSRTQLQQKELLGKILIQSESMPVEGLLEAFNLWKKYTKSTVLNHIILQNFQKIISLEVDSTNPVYLLKEHFNPIVLESEIINVKKSRSGKFIFGWMENKQIFIFNPNTQHITYLPVDGDLIHIEMSERDSLIALVLSNNKGLVCDFSGSVKYTFETSLNAVMNEKLVRFFNAGNNHLIAVKDSAAKIYDKYGRVLYELKGHSGSVNSVDLSPDNRFISTASSDKEIFIWYYNHHIKEYSRYGILSGHKDTVWSCEFNSSGKYVLTASADSTTRIWDLNGRQVNPEFNFSVNDPNGRYRLNDSEYDEDVTNPRFSAYYRKNCNASFNPDEMSLVVTGYSYIADSASNTIPDYNQALFYSEFSKFSTDYYTPFSDFVHSDYDTIKSETFRQIIVSPTGYFVAVSSDTRIMIDLVANDGLRLIKLKGRNAMFSNNGDEIFWVHGNKIHSFLLNPEKIMDLIIKYNITKYTRSNDNIIIGI